jgi:hypothetical protein
MINRPLTRGVTVREGRFEPGATHARLPELASLSVK